jgi:hypothetical protein
MSETQTPRTDAQYKEYARRDNAVKCVDIDFARQLERELAEAKATIETLEIRHVAVMLHTQAVVDERNELRQCAADLAMLIRRLCRVVAKYDANNAVRAVALDFLHRKGLEGSPLKGAKP